MTLPMWLRVSKTEHILAVSGRGSLVAACSSLRVVPNIVEMRIFRTGFEQPLKQQVYCTATHGGARARHQRSCLDDAGRWRGPRGRPRGRPRRDRATAERRRRPTRWPFARVSHLSFGPRDTLPLNSYRKRAAFPGTHCCAPPHAIHTFPAIRYPSPRPASIAPPFCPVPSPFFASLIPMSLRVCDGGSLCPAWTFSASPYSRNPNPAPHTSAPHYAAPSPPPPTPPTAALPSTIAAVPAPVPATATAATRTAIATSVPARVPATAVAAMGTVVETGGRGGRARARRRATAAAGSVGVSGGRRASPSSTRRPPGAWRRVWGRCLGWCSPGWRSPG